MGIRCHKGSNTINLNNLVDQDADYWQVHGSCYKVYTALTLGHCLPLAAASLY